MKMLVLVQVEFDAEAQGVDARCDAEHVARIAARHELAKDEEEEPKVYYVYL